MTFRTMINKKRMEKLKIFIVFRKIIVLVEFQFPFNGVKFPLYECLTLIKRFFLIKLLYYLEFGSKVFFKTQEESLGDLPKTFLFKQLICFIFYLFIEVFQFFGRCGNPRVYVFFHLFLVILKCELFSFHTLILTQITPCVLDIRNSSIIYRGQVASSK